MGDFAQGLSIGFAHGRSNSLLAVVVGLYGTLKDIPFLSITKGSFRKVNERECQPDLAFYVGKDLPNIPRNNSPIDTSQHGSPSLAIEISATTLSDDLGQKCLLYEQLGVVEYWVVDVASATVIAFEVANNGSRQIRTSSVLTGLEIEVIEETLRQIQIKDDGAINRWLLMQFGSELSGSDRE